MKICPRTGYGGRFAGNYGNAWRLQDKEFGTFNGPIMMTTNCLATCIFHIELLRALNAARLLRFNLERWQPGGARQPRGDWRK